MTRRDFLPSAFAVASVAAPAQTPLPGEFDYVDWSWQRWREITHEERPGIQGEQSGKAELITLAPKDRAGWEARRDSFQRVLSVFLGRPPATRAPLAVQLLGDRRENGFTRREIRYQSEAGEPVPAYVLIPDKLQRPAPAVLCPHQTTQAGKNSPAGLADVPQQHTAANLARRGYVTLTWDALCFGERHNRRSGHYGDAIPFYRKWPEWSLMGKMIWDMSRGIDFLETLEFVDPKRIGSIGHSHGGYTTLLGMALDRRIAVGVSNCGFDTFRMDGNTWRWSRATALLPRLGFYVSSRYLNMDFYRGVPDSEVIQTPFDMHQVLALIAPRPVMLTTSDEDFVFPNGGWSARQALARLTPLYRQLEAEDRVGSYFFRGGHAFPEEASSRGYAWLDRWLKA